MIKRHYLLICFSLFLALVMALMPLPYVYRYLSTRLGTVSAHVLVVGFTPPS